MLNRLANTNVSCTNPSYSELDALFIYNMTLVEIHFNLILKILADYENDKYWVYLYYQVLANKDLDNDKALLPFILGYSYRLNNNYYLLPCPKSPTDSSLKLATPYLGSSPIVLEDSRLLPPNETKLLYYINKTIGNLWLYIPLILAPEILQIIYKKGHPGFSYYYKIVTHS